MQLNEDSANGRRTRSCWLAAIAILTFAVAAVIAILNSAAPAAPATDSSWPPAGKPQRVEVSRDAWVSAAKDEADSNTGGSNHLKTKGTIEFSLVDLDPAQLKGKIVTGATLHLHLVSKEILRRLTVSSLATDWVEGTGEDYAVQPGSVCFKGAEEGKKPWAYPGSDITAVFGGRGNTIWAFADPSAPDANNYQVVAVDPAVVQARIAGISKGFVVFDDVGSEYQRDGNQFTYINFPNRFMSSREDKKFAPFWTIYVNGESTQSPQAVAFVQQSQSAQTLAPEQAMVTWPTPKSDGPAKVIGFFARVSDGPNFDWDRATVVPQYLIPMAGDADARVTMHLRDMDFKPGAHLTVGVRAVDGAGNIGPVTTGNIILSGDSTFALPPVTIKPFTDGGALPKVGGLTVAILDPLDKVNAVSDVMVPKQAEGYRAANHLWSAAEKKIRLYGAKNEDVAFQILLSGKSDKIEATVTLDGGSGGTPAVEMSRFANIGPDAWPDALLPLDGPFALPASDEKVAGQKNQSLLAAVYIPHDAAAGVHTGTLKINSDGATLSIPIELHVWDFTLPDSLSFIPQLNSYGLPEGEEIKYYRLAHKMRTNLISLDYNWRGGVHKDWSPEWKDGKFDWTIFDRNMGPLLDGTAFSDLPRKGVPVTEIFLTLNENFPISIDEGFKGGYWADEAMSPEYRKRFVDACGQLAAHFKEKGWDKTLIGFFLNNKVYFKNDKSGAHNDWAKCSAPWCFDEPDNTQDFWALRWFGKAFHEGVDPQRGDVRLVFCCDISRPQWQRNILDGVADEEDIGALFRRYNRMVMDRKAKLGEIILNYGDANSLDTSNLQPVAWCLDTWTLGGDGVVPWQVIGKRKSWQGLGDMTQCLFYPSQPDGIKGPIPSIRMRSFMRGQEDVEYLSILADATHAPRWAIANAVRKNYVLEGEVTIKKKRDAGVVSYDKLNTLDIWELRMRIGAMLDALKPPAKAMIRDFKPLQDESKNVVDLGYVTVAPPHGH